MSSCKCINVLAGKRRDLKETINQIYHEWHNSRLEEKILGIKGIQLAICPCSDHTKILSRQDQFQTQLISYFLQWNAGAFDKGMGLYFFTALATFRLEASFLFVFDGRECTMLCFVLIFSQVIIIYFFVYACSHAHTTGCVQMLEDELWDSILSIYPVGSRDQAQVIRHAISPAPRCPIFLCSILR